jgi:ribosomal protein S18 acetylase RimI-like enzyme
VRADESAGLVASVEDERVGLLTYEIRENECEIISLNSLREHFGVGSALLAAAKQAAQEARCRRVWLITTNDNLSAIGFYRRRGMQLKAVYPNALAQSRKIKPEIPLVGNEGIPLRDEIELEYLL